MNEHILLTMKYLDDNNSVTAQELSDNYKAAHDATAAHVAAFAIDDDYAAAAAAACAIAIAAVCVYTYAIAAADADINYVKKKVDDFFSITGENKQDYINEIAKNKGE